MNETYRETIFNILFEILGNPKKNDSNQKEWEFNCQSNVCKFDTNKYNLAFNFNKGLYHCWKCGDKGNIYKLIKTYTKNQEKEEQYLKIIENAYPDYNNFDNINKKNFELINPNTVTCPLPYDFEIINISNKKTKHFEYLIQRKISTNYIVKYNIGYSTKTIYRNRIIIPSFNRYNKINYFVSRAIEPTENLKYLNPSEKYLKGNVPNKNDIIFNEKFIKYDQEIFLTEGIFDAIRLNNAIPLLGKTINIHLFNKIIQYKPPIVIALDKDAIRESFKLLEYIKSLNVQVKLLILQDYKDISEVFEKNTNKKAHEIIENSIYNGNIEKHLLLLNVI